MTRAPLLPVRLVDGVWTTEGVVEIGGQTLPAKVSLPARSPGIDVRNFRCVSDPVLFLEATLPDNFHADLVRAFAEYTPPRHIFAAVALDGSGVWAIGDTEQEARAGAVDHRDYYRDCARSVGDDFPPPETDAAWLDTLALVTLSGTTESLRRLVTALGDDVAPWCPQDLWDNPEPVKES